MANDTAGVIWKFPLEITDEQIIEIPTFFKIMTVQTQEQRPVLWALVDPDSEKVKIKIKTYGTGQLIHTPPGHYIDSYQVVPGGLVFHVFFSGRVCND